MVKYTYHGKDVTDVYLRIYFIGGEVSVFERPTSGATFSFGCLFDAPCFGVVLESVQ